MLKLFIRFLFVIITITTVIGCSSSNKELAGLNDIEYKIVRERLDFEKLQNANLHFDIDKDTNQSLTLLLDAHIKIMYKINLKGQQKTRIKNILYIDLVSKKRVLIKKLLIEKKDFFFDNVNNAVYLALDIPYIYLLDGKFKFDILMTMITKKRDIVKRNISMVYEIRPMHDNGEKYMSFLYEKDFESENIDEFILLTLQEELKITNLNSFEKNYKKRHVTLLNRDN